MATITVKKSAVSTVSALSAAVADIGTTGEVRVYTGSNPSECEGTEPTGQIGAFNMSTVAFIQPAVDTNTKATATANSITNDTNTGAGTAASWRIYDTQGSGGACIFQGEVSESPDTSGSLVFDETLFQSGGTATIDSFLLNLDE